MTNTARTKTVLGATVAGLAIAVALAAGPFRSDVSGNAHKLDRCFATAEAC